MTVAIPDHLDLAGRVPLTPARLPVREAVARIVGRKASIRQERLSGIHNPWGHGIALTDPWAFLELCESALVVDAANHPMQAVEVVLREDVALGAAVVFGDLPDVWTITGSAIIVASGIYLLRREQTVEAEKS